MKIYRSSLFVAFISAIPWILASIGIIQFLGIAWIFLTVSTMSVATIFIVAIMHYLSTSKNIGSGSHISKQNNLLRNIIFCFIVASYIISLFSLVSILIKFNFNLAAIRYYFFRSQDSLEVLFGGNKYFKMLFNHVLDPLVISSIITIEKWGLRETSILGLYCLIGIATGGRFALYKTVIILIINTSFKNKIIHFKKLHLAIILLFLVLAVTIHVNRQINTWGISSIDALKKTVGEVYAYHSIQFGIMNESLDAPIQYGPITGLLTPFYVISGKTSPEGELLIFLDNVEFSPQERSYNAFGTSIMFFLPIFQWIGVPLFFLSFWILCFWVIFMTKNNKRVALSKFLTYSLFFSGFQPYLFSFKWWLCIPIIYILSEKNQLRTIKK